jgi:hypothetical protein
MDLARFIRTRRGIADPGTGELAFEAFYGYLLPQFEGIDEVAGERLYRQVRKLVGPGNDQRLRTTLRSVLGLELASAEPATSVDETGARFDEAEEFGLAESNDG